MRTRVLTYGIGSHHCSNAGVCCLTDCVLAVAEAVGDFGFMTRKSQISVCRSQRPTS